MPELNPSWFTMITWEMYVLCAAGFLSALVDSIAGGGGIIGLPAFLLAGVPPHFALVTNKFAATAASLTSSIRYARSAKVDWMLMKYLAPMSLIGAVLGVGSVLKIDQKTLYPVFSVLIFVVGTYSFFSKSIGLENRFQKLKRWTILSGMALALSIGFYDGFFGPGTGTFLIIGLINIYGFDFVNAGGNARFLNFISNISALVLFMIQGKVNYYYAIPVAFAMILGAQVGTRMALKNGARFVKPIFGVMSLLVAGRLVWGFFK